MSFGKAILLIVVLSFEHRIVSSRPECKKTSSCSCAFPSGDSVDLSPLNTGDKSKPAFQDIAPDTGNDQFSYNPCAAFDESGCKDVAVCNLHANENNTEYFPIGTQDSADFSFNDDGVLQITYESKDEGSSRSSFITLSCQEETGVPVLLALGETPLGSGLYYFKLISPFGCYPAQDNTDKETGVTVGTYICIGVGVILIVYLIGGIIFNSAIRKSTGAERIPNVHFWGMVPGLVKDGFLLTFSCIRGKGKLKVYDKI